MSTRILGYDLARALAVFGMVVVNYHVVMGGQEGAAWLRTAARMFEGRAVATFVVLAGVGLTLLTRRARESADPALIARGRRAVLERGALLFVIGIAYTPIWPADILHFYGLYFVAGALLFTVRDRWLWAAAAGFVAVFVVLLLLLDYESGWDFSTLTYVDLWTLPGMLRHLFFNGFHPVFPWAALLVIGMWLGRQDLRDSRRRAAILVTGCAVWLVTELLAKALVALAAASAPGTPREEIDALLGTGPLPPMPQYILAGGGAAVAIIAACVGIGARFGSSPWLVPLYRTGQLSLTLYVLHVLLGMGTLEAIGLLDDQSIELVWLSALIFIVFAVAFATAWYSRFRMGPLEWVFRRLAS